MNRTRLDATRRGPGEGLKNLLVIACYFPPIGGGGVQRALKMAKYLPQFGWRPLVLALDPVWHVSLDPTLLEELPPEVVVHRVREWRPRILFGAMAPTTAAVSPPSSATRSGAAVTPVPAGTSSGGKGLIAWRRRFVQWMKRARMYVLIPDDRILWYVPAVREGRRMLARYGARALLSTSGPYTDHLVGLALRRHSGLPWVADFRDPWTQNMHRPGIRWREALEERMERAVMREADVVLTVTRSFAEGFRSKYGDVIRRLEVIHNGFDAADFAGVVPERVEGRCTFVYTGIFYRQRHPRRLLRAVRRLIDRGAIDRRRLRLRFAGVFDYPGYTENADAVRELGLGDVVEVLGHVPHRRAVALLKGADVLLLINDVDPAFGGTFIPGKLFEYMAAQRPILALSLPGEAASVVERFGLGEVVPPEDDAAIEAAVLRFYRRWERGELAGPQPLPPEAYRLYERREQARTLAELLDELLEARGEDVRGREPQTARVEP